jgi:hypothetical protein
MERAASLANQSPSGAATATDVQPVARPNVRDDGTRELAPQHEWREAEHKLGLTHDENDVLPPYTEMAEEHLRIEAMTE